MHSEVKRIVIIAALVIASLTTTGFAGEPSQTPGAPSVGSNTTNGQPGPTVGSSGPTSTETVSAPRSLSVEPRKMSLFASVPPRTRTSSTPTTIDSAWDTTHGIGQLVLDATLVGGYGAMLQAIGTTYPKVGAKLPTMTSASAFTVLNGATTAVFTVTGAGNAGFGIDPISAARVYASAAVATSGDGIRVDAASASGDNHVDYGFLDLFNTDTTNNNHARIDFGSRNTTGTYQYTLAAIEAVFVDHSVNRPITDLAFVVGDNVQERMRIKSDGKVGIGTSTPTVALDVVGDGHFSGSVNASYQDVAEWVPAQSGMPAGTVVVLNREMQNAVIPSAAAYDSAVAGVVSARPGLLLGEAGDAKARIATTGRVKVRVDATKNPIRIGDLLVTSDKSGTAMKSEPMEINGRKFHQPGTIIGKALESLAGGEGEILVLLSLQ